MNGVRDRRLIVVALAIIASAFSAQLTGGAEPSENLEANAGRVAVRVNRAVISRRQLERAFLAALLQTPGSLSETPSALWDTVIDETIEEELLFQQSQIVENLINEAFAQRIVRRQREQAIRINGGRERWEKRLEELDMTPEEWETITERGFYTMAWVFIKAGLLSAGPDEIKEFYETRSDTLRPPERYRLSRIDVAVGALLPIAGQPDARFTPDLAQSFVEAFRQRLVSAPNAKTRELLFSEFAGRFASTPELRATSGRLLSSLGREWLDKTELHPADAAALVGLSETKAVSEVYVRVPSPQTFALLLLREKAIESPPDFSTSADAISRRIEDEKYADARRAIFDELKRDATIIRVDVRPPQALILRAVELRNASSKAPKDGG